MMLLDVADNLQTTTDDVEATHTLDQLVLRWYRQTKKTHREKEDSAKMMAAILTKTLVG